MWRISPVKIAARDRSDHTYVIEHRIGKAGGSLTIQEIMDRLGITDEMEKRIYDIKRLIKKNPDYEKDLILREKQNAKSTANKVVRRFGDALLAFYAPQGLRPRCGFIMDTDGKNKFFIQGLVDSQTLAPVRGDVKDLTEWSQSEFTASRSGRDRNFQATEQSKALLRLPGINTDIREALHLLVNYKSELPALPPPTSVCEKCNVALAPGQVRFCKDCEKKAS